MKCLPGGAISVQGVRQEVEERPSSDASAPAGLVIIPTACAVGAAAGRRCATSGAGLGGSGTGSSVSGFGGVVASGAFVCAPGSMGTDGGPAGLGFSIG